MKTGFVLSVLLYIARIFLRKKYGADFEDFSKQVEEIDEDVEVS